MIRIFPIKNKHQLFVTYVFTFILIISCKNKNTLPDPLEAGWNNEAVCEVIDDNSNVRVLKCTFAPGIGHEKHYHNPLFG